MFTPGAARSTVEPWVWIVADGYRSALQARPILIGAESYRRGFTSDGDHEDWCSSRNLGVVVIGAWAPPAGCLLHDTRRDGCSIWYADTAGERESLRLHW